MVIATTCIFSGLTTFPSRPFSICSQRQKATGFAPGRRAALRKPCGLSHMSSRYTSAISGGTATGGPSPSRCQEDAPCVTCVCRVARWVGVPPRQPSPYFQEAGASPGCRSKVSTLVPASQLMTRV